MKIRSAILTEMSGKLGGAVGSKARGGLMTLRKLVIPSNPRTNAQSRARNILAACAAAWLATLDDTARAAWTALAHPQESGIDVYVSSNANLMRASLPRQDVAPESRVSTFNPPATLSIDTDLSSAVTGFSATDDYNTGTVAGHAKGFVDFFFTIPQKSSRLARQHNFRFGGSAQIVATPLTDTTFATALTNALTAFLSPIATLTMGDVVYVKIIVGTANGKTSVPAEYRVVIGAI